MDRRKEGKDPQKLLRSIVINLTLPFRLAGFFLPRHPLQLTFVLLLFTCRNFIRFRRTIVGGAKVLRIGIMSVRDNLRFRDIINRTFQQVLDTMIYETPTSCGSTLNSHEFIEFMAFASTIIGLPERFCWIGPFAKCSSRAG